MFETLNLNCVLHCPCRSCFSIKLVKFEKKRDQKVHWQSNCLLSLSLQVGLQRSGTFIIKTSLTCHILKRNEDICIGITYCNVFSTCGTFFKKWCQCNKISNKLWVNKEDYKDFFWYFWSWTTEVWFCKPVFSGETLNCYMKKCLREWARTSFCEHAVCDIRINQIETSNKIYIPFLIGLN